jgi:6-phosphogluconolactonase
MAGVIIQTMTTLTTRRFAARAELDAALAERLGRCLAADPTASAAAVMLSGGTTPLPAYRALGERRIVPATQLRVLFSDDRYVPATSPASNYHQSQPLLLALALPPGRVLRVRTELPLAAAAADYAAQLDALLKAPGGVGLGLLGLGADGHTASLFSAADLERARGQLAIAVQRPDGMSGISVTPRFLAQVREPLFVVAGAGKDDAIRRLIAGDLGLTAWAAVQECAAVELWVQQD